MSSTAMDDPCLRLLVAATFQSGVLSCHRRICLATACIFDPVLEQTCLAEFAQVHFESHQSKPLHPSCASSSFFHQCQHQCCAHLKMMLLSPKLNSKLHRHCSRGASFQI